MLQKDRRLPVLYLRPFKDDRNSGGEFPFMPQRTEEFVASRLLRQIGPVIAVHNPGDQLSRVGALRIIHRGGEWEQLVFQLMDCAELVALRLGVSTGIQIEIQQAIARVDPSRLIAMVPKSHLGTKKENHSIWQTFAKEVGWSEREIEIVSGTDTLFVRFGPDWCPVVSKLPPVWLRLVRFGTTSPPEIGLEIALTDMGFDVSGVRRRRLAIIGVLLASIAAIIFYVAYLVL